MLIALKVFLSCLVPFFPGLLFSVAADMVGVNTPNLDAILSFILFIGVLSGIVVAILFIWG